jgi:ribosomal protein L21
LPKIAAYYKVSIDDLLGVEKIRQEEVNLKQIASTLMADYGTESGIGAERTSKIYKQLT